MGATHNTTAMAGKTIVALTFDSRNKKLNLTLSGGAVYAIENGNKMPKLSNTKRAFKHRRDTTRKMP
jgi:hypothetical protein